MLGSLAFLLMALFGCMLLALGVIAFFAIGAMRDGRRFLNQSGEAIVSAARASSSSAVGRGKERLGRVSTAAAARSTGSTGSTGSARPARPAGTQSPGAAVTERVPVPGKPGSKTDGAGAARSALVSITSVARESTGKLGAAIQAGRARAAQAREARSGGANGDLPEPRPVIGKGLRPNRPDRDSALG